MTEAGVLKDKNTTTDSYDQLSVIVFSYEPILMVTMASLGIILNLISIASIISGKRIHKEVKIQMTNLAIADLLACLVPEYLEQFWVFKTDTTCRVMSFIGYGAFYAGPLWNMVISLERVFVVFFPFKVRLYSGKLKAFVAVCVWMIGLGSAVWYILYGFVVEMRDAGNGDLLY